MKIGSLATLLVVAILSLTTACNDDLNSIGLDVQPSEDDVFVFADTISLASNTSTIKVDSICAKSVNGLLGQFDDPIFGSLKSDYMCQFFCTEGNAFPDSVINNKIDSIDVMLYYKTSTGDTLAPMAVSAYKVFKPLDENLNFYSNINPKDYCNNFSTLLGSQAYTASEIGMPDSLYKASGYHNIRVRLPLALGQDIFEKSKTDGILASKDAFAKYFPGVYLTTTYGTGNIIEVAYTYLNIYFNYEETDSDGNVTVESGSLSMVTTKEVVQLNHFSNTNIDDLLKPNETTSYIKSPAGVFTQIDIPMDEINEKIKPTDKNYITNGVEFNVRAYGTPQDAKYPLKAPTYMMIIPAKDYKGFFEKFSAFDDMTMNSFIGTYIAKYDTTNLVYKFNNLTPLIKRINNEGYTGSTVPAYLVPVTINTNSTDGSVISVTHYLKPAAVRIRKDKDNINFVVVHSEF